MFHNLSKFASFYNFCPLLSPEATTIAIMFLILLYVYSVSISITFLWEFIICLTEKLVKASLKYTKLNQICSTQYIYKMIILHRNKGYLNIKARKWYEWFVIGRGHRTFLQTHLSSSSWCVACVCVRLREMAFVKGH